MAKATVKLITTASFDAMERLVAPFGVAAHGHTAPKFRMLTC